MSTTFERPPDETEAFALLTSGGLVSSLNPETPAAATTAATADAGAVAVVAATLGALPLGAHLVLRCRKDWRTATILAVAPDKVTLSVSSPTGRTYRLRRPFDSPLAFDGSIPLLGTTAAASCWRAGLARYDVRW